MEIEKINDDLEWLAVSFAGHSLKWKKGSEMYLKNTHVVYLYSCICICICICICGSASVLCGKIVSRQVALESRVYGVSRVYVYLIICLPFRKQCM